LTGIDLVLNMRKENRLAPRTIRHIYFALRQIFHEAVADELLEGHPCVLNRGVIPKIADKDPEWRATAIFTRDEAEQLISDPRIPPDRRVLYALKTVAGLRHSEAATLRWRQYDATLKPLGGIDLSYTKSKVPRRVSVHPTLARILAAWRIGGWAQRHGRNPSADDLITPTINFTPRDKHEAPNQFRYDLDALGLRHRRGHDLRRTFITLALVDGARRDLLETVSHGPRGDIISVYSTFPWPALCEEVAKLRICLHDGEVLAFNTRQSWLDKQKRTALSYVSPPRPSGSTILPREE
jgi:integrase